MKINYEFVNGEKTEIEVDDRIGNFIIESKRLERNLKERERYHCYSIEGATFEGEDYADDKTPETIFFYNIKCEHINQALNSLSEIQRRRLLLMADGVSINEIARREGLQPSTVWKSIEGAKKKFLKNHKKF